jgi:hypothetical protein
MHFRFTLLLLFIALTGKAQDSLSFSIPEIQKIRQTQIELKRCNFNLKLERGKSFIFKDQYNTEIIKFKKAELEIEKITKNNFTLTQKLITTKKRNKIFIVGASILGGFVGILLAK